MKRHVTILALLIAVVIPVIATAADDVAKKAEGAALSWLASIDAGKYAKSWDDSAEAFRGAVTKEKWEAQLGAVRGQLGAMKSRKLKSVTPLVDPAGAPKGEYVVVQFDTDFEKKGGAVETVTPMKEKDGSWKVSGYYVK